MPSQLFPIIINVLHDNNNIEVTCSSNFATSTSNCNYRYRFPLEIKIYTKTSYKGTSSLISQIPPCIVVSSTYGRSSLPLSLATRLRANYTEERKRSDGRKEERLRHPPTHVTVSIAHYLRSIEHNTATLLPLSLSFLASTHIGPARKRAPAVLLSLRLCPETMNKRKKGGREGEGGKVAGTVNVLENEKKKKKIVYKYRGR